VDHEDRMERHRRKRLTVGSAERPGSSSRFHNADAIHSRLVRAVQPAFSFASKHGERVREPDVAETLVNSRFPASPIVFRQHRAAPLQLSSSRVVFCSSFRICGRSIFANVEVPWTTRISKRLPLPSLRNACRHSPSPRANAGMRQRERGFFWGEDLDVRQLSRAAARARCAAQPHLAIRPQWSYLPRFFQRRSAGRPA